VALVLSHHHYLHRLQLFIIHRPHQRQAASGRVQWKVATGNPATTAKAVRHSAKGRVVLVSVCCLQHKGK
jgi:hypothetical protein